MHSSLKSLFAFLSVATLILVGAAFAQEVLQAQSHNTLDGVEVSLLKVDVRNNIVTLRFSVKNTGSSKQTWQFNYENCYIVDETNQKKYFPLKDSDGLYIAGPFYDNNNGGRFWFDLQPNGTKGIWIKFPEPTDAPETISVFLPGVSPFEEVSLKSGS
jgi:hypothetical protein